MGVYKIKIQELLARVIEIEANSTIDAISKVSEKYKKAEINLNNNHFVAVDFFDTNTQTEKDEKNELVNDLIDYLFETEKKHFEEFDTEIENHIYKKLLRLNELNKSLI